MSIVCGFHDALIYLDLQTKLTEEAAKDPLPGTTGRSKEGLESAQEELGNEAIVVSSDARSLPDLDALASRAKAEFDTIDLLFVNEP